MRTSKNLLCLSICTTLTMLSSLNAYADDTEVFFGNSSSSAVGPNILLILDTSGSMHTIDSGNTQSRATIVKNAAKNLLDYPALANANIGLMRYSTGRKTTDPQVTNDGYQTGGGMIVYPISPLSTNKSNLKNEIDSWKFAGPTPLAESLYEAYRYFKGGNVLFGDKSYECTVDDTTLCPNNSSMQTKLSVASSRTGGVINTPAGTNTYDSPMDNDSSCQKNYIVFLTDGDGNSDKEAVSPINTLTGLTSCTVNSSPAETTNCLRDLAAYMHHVGSSTTTLRDLRTDVPGQQNVVTNFVGFGTDVSTGSTSEIAKAATAGGGKTYYAANPTSLDAAFQDFANQAVSDSEASFTSPSVAVNAFNKTQVLEDMYIAMFKPTTKLHWNGNLKKYKLRDSKIVGRGSSLTEVSSTSAVDSSGFMSDSSKDFWELTTDTTTDYTQRGGAANMIPNPSGTSSRNVYTYIGNNKPSSFASLSGHLFSNSNSALTDTVMATTASGCSTTVGATNLCKANLINWARGDADGSTTTATDRRKVMGDPVHSSPAVVIYGATGSTTMAKLNDAVVFMATNDGYLHAIKVSDGTELWSYIPQELLSDLKNIQANAAASTKHYSLDGELRLLKYDINLDGIVNGDDRVFLYFSQGRGGDNYYAIDVTDKANPKFMWSLDSTTLPKVSKSWSAPTLGRVNISTASQNPQKLVLIFGGGYDTAEDAQAYVSTTPAASCYTSGGSYTGDCYGNAVYMIDAVKGTLLWSQSHTTSGAFSKMTHAIPSNVTVMDTNSDGYSDRMYVGDMAGQLWRFDITNGAANTTTSPLVEGGVIASVGAKSETAESAPITINNRSFYSAPDVAKFIVPGGANYYNIGIGSGDRAYPKSNITTADRFYGIRDYRLGPMSQADYDGITSPITDANLTTITGTSAVSIGSNGWKLLLNSTEKALAQSVTVSGVVMFTTFIPGVAASSSCSPTTGSGRAYTISIETGMKYFTNLYETFNTTGLPSQISIVNEDNVVKTLEGETTPSSSASSSSASSITNGTCLSGVNILGSCVDFGSRVKTFWQEAGVN